jgi:hypothetical protein
MMTDIEAKALALVREVLAERDLSDKRAVRRDVSPYTEALCRAIEQHEAFKQEVSDVVYRSLMSITKNCVADAAGDLSRFIIPKPKPDPLVEVIAGWTGGTVLLASDLRAALEARGLEIRKKDE